MKTTNYLVNVLAKAEAEEAGADEALFVDDDGFIVEATTANVFAVFGDRLATPPLSSGCLPGVTRAHVLRLAPQAGLRPEERPIPRAALHEADEAFLTASVTEVAPIVSLDGVRVGEGKPGPRAAAVHRAYRAHAHQAQHK